MKKSDVFFESDRNLRKTGILDTVLEDYPLESFFIFTSVLLIIASIALYSTASKKKLAINLGAMGFITLAISIIMTAVMSLL